MIKLDISDYCNDCPEFDAETHTLRTLYALDQAVETRIACSNAEKCNRIKKYLETAMERKDENSNGESS